MGVKMRLPQKDIKFLTNEELKKVEDQIEHEIERRINYLTRLNEKMELLSELFG